MQYPAPSDSLSDDIDPPFSAPTDGGQASTFDDTHPRNDSDVDPTELYHQGSISTPGSSDDNSDDTDDDMIEEETPEYTPENDPHISAS